MSQAIRPLLEKRLEDLSMFMDLPLFPDGCDSWKDFLFFCKQHEGKPFTLRIKRCYGESTKEINNFYFFGKVSVSEDRLSLGEGCFTPLDFNLFIPRIFNFLSASDLALDPDPFGQMSKVVAISFDKCVFEEKLLETSLSNFDSLIRCEGAESYIFSILHQLESLTKKFDSSLFPFGKIGHKLEEVSRCLDKKKKEPEVKATDI